MEAEKNTKRICEICRFQDTNVLDYGEWKTSEDCTVHYFCALLSSGAVQNGDDHEGIGGFLVSDIRKLTKAYAKTRCRYCKQKRATVRCSEPKCPRIFHVKCGVKHKCLNQFEDPFKTFCHDHIKIVEKYEKHADFWHCQICTEPMGEYHPITSIPSCCDQGYYHKKCMQKYAITAGYLAKCPSCGNDADGYRKFLMQRGIFCPDKDADWELSDEAFQSLLYVHKTCDATICYCPNGRDYIEGKGKWKLYRCRFCGSVGNHAECREDGSTGSFACRSCKEKDSILITVQTQSTNNSNANITNKSIDKVNQSIKSNADDAGSSNHNAKSPANWKRQHDFDEEDEQMVWKLVPTKKTTFRKNSLHLMKNNDEPSIDPLCDTERKSMRNSRLDMFFSNADFNVKPPPPPWLI